VTEFDSVIPAGGSGTLTAKIKTTTTQSSKVSKSVAVTTDAAGAQRLTLSLTFKSVTVISVLPRPRVNLRGIQGAKPTETLIFRRADGEKLEITGVETKDKNLVITTRPVTEEMVIGRQKAVLGDVLVIASVAPDVETASTSGRFKIRTNHPDAEVVDVTYTLRLRPMIEVRPAQVRLLLQEGNSPARTMLFRVQHNKRGEFKLTGVKPSNPEIFRAKMVDGDVKQQVHTVAVMLQDEVIPGSLDKSMLETLVVSTDDATQPELTVSVLIEPRTLRKPGKPRPVE